MQFWNIVLEGTKTTVTTGLIPSSGTTTSRSFATRAEAVKAMESLIEDRKTKGYKEKKDEDDDDDDDGDDDKDDKKKKKKKKGKKEKKEMCKFKSTVSLLLFLFLLLFLLYKTLYLVFHSAARAEFRKKVMRHGWKPKIVDGEPVNATDSKFCGAPFLPTGKTHVHILPFVLHDVCLFVCLFVC